MILIGKGRIGTALHAAFETVGIETVLIGREEGDEHLGKASGEPIIVAVRNDDLESVIGRVPSHRRPDLVFIQNGMIGNFLMQHHVGIVTRGLLYFAVREVGGPIEPGDSQWFTGPHGPRLVRHFEQIGLAAQTVDPMQFRLYELEKCMWLAVNGVLCERHGCDVAEVAKAHIDDVQALVAELATVGRAALGVDVPVGYLVDRITKYSLSIPGYCASVKEFPWRNGWFDSQGKTYGVLTPNHRQWLRDIGKGSFLSEDD